VYILENLPHGRTFTVDVIDSVADYAELMSEIFDLSQIRKLFLGQIFERPFRVRLDAMHGGRIYFHMTIFNMLIHL